MSGFESHLASCLVSPDNPGRGDYDLVGGETPPGQTEIRTQGEGSSHLSTVAFA